MTRRLVIFHNKTNIWKEGQYAFITCSNHIQLCIVTRIHCFNCYSFTGIDIHWRHNVGSGVSLCTCVNRSGWKNITDTLYISGLKCLFPIWNYYTHVYFRLEIVYATCSFPVGKCLLMRHFRLEITNMLLRTGYITRLFPFGNHKYATVHSRLGNNTNYYISISYEFNILILMFLMGKFYNTVWIT